jgi:hypothetical protein
VAIVHVVFSCSAAGSLKLALELLQRDERVVYVDDDLSTGPIDPPSPALRAEWIADKLGYDHLEICERADAVWAEAASEEASPIVWFSRRWAPEYAGFLEFVWRRQDLPMKIVDVADLELTRDGRPTPTASLAFAGVHHETIVAHRLREQAQELTATARAAARATWKALRHENAALRVMSPAGLISAPLDHYDAMILSLVGEEWVRGARLVGQLLGSLHPQTSDFLLWARICDLVDGRALEGRGELESYRDSWVRKPAAEPGSR